MLPSQRLGLNLRGIYYLFAYPLPKHLKEDVRKKIMYAGFDEPAEEWLGSTLFVAAFLGFDVSAGLWVLGRAEDLFLVLGAGTAMFLVTIISTYTLLFMQIEDRKNRVEKVLPDALQMIGSNLRAGMTPISALRAAAKPELGPLEEEIKYATAKSLGTGSFTDAIGDMSSRLNSDIFSRSVALFKASLKAGGHLADMLENTAQDIRSMQDLKRELLSSTRMYILFIMFTIVVGTPLLLAVSLQFVTMVNNLQKKTASTGFGGEMGGAFVSMKSPLTLEFLSNIAMVIIIVTSILSSMLVGVIREGRELSGLKYAPLIMVAAYVVFYVMREHVLRLMLPMI